MPSSEELIPGLDEARRIEAACEKFAEYGIDFRCPWQCDLDDAELERFIALRAVLAVAHPAPTAADTGLVQRLTAEQQLAAAHEQIAEKVVTAIEAYEAAYEELCPREECIRRALAALTLAKEPTDGQ